MMPSKLIAKVKAVRRKWLNSLANSVASSLAWKHLTAFLLVSLAPLLLVCTLIIWEQFRDERQMIANQLQSVNTFQAALIDAWLANMEENLRLSLLANQTQIVKLAITPPNLRAQLIDADLRKEFNYLLQLMPGSDQAFLLALDGTIIAGSNGVRIGEFRGIQAYFKRGLTQLSTQIQTLSFSSTSEGINAIIASMPVKDKNGRVVGVLCARESLQYLNNLMTTRPGMGETGETFIVGENHILLTPLPKSLLRPGETYLSTPAANQALNDRNNYFFGDGIDYRGQPVTLAYHWLPGLRAVLIAKQDTRETYRKIYQATYTSIAVFLITIIATGIIALLFSRRIVHPIVQLARVANRISIGELDLRAESRSDDEVGQLAHAFNEMAVHLAELIKTQQRQIDQLQQAHELIASKSHALEKQTAFLNAVIDNVPVGLFAKDARDKFRMTIWNIAAAKIFQIPSELVLGKLNHDLWPKEQADAFLLDDITVIRGKKRIDIPAEKARVADGTDIILHTIKVPITNPVDGQTDFLLGMCEDITARIKADSIIHELNATLERKVAERTAQLAAASEALKAFNYSVAHDLRAPLRGIDGWSLALLEDCNDQLDDQGRQYLQRIRADTQRMGQLIDDLLRLSKVSSAPMNIGVVDLTEMAAKIIHRLKETAPQRQVRWSVQDRLLTQGDQNLLEIAITNLLENAWKFTGKTPDAQIEVGCVERDGEMVFFVRDNGAGFDPQYAASLFSPFQRMHTQQDFPGTGIGLATVRRIFHRHGGRVWAEAEVGKGATFYFQIPPTMG